MHACAFLLSNILIIACQAICGETLEMKLSGVHCK